MTTLAWGDAGDWGFSRPGASEASRRLDKLARDAVLNLKGGADQLHVFNDLVALRHEYGLAGEDNDSLFKKAEQFLLALPSSLPVPELSLDHDGDLAFDWRG